jgi:hypothetical protein
MPTGNFSENVYQLKADIFAPDLGLMNYIQYDTMSRQLGWNARLAGSPSSEIYLVYNRNWEGSGTPGRLPLADARHQDLLSIRPNGRSGCLTPSYKGGVKCQRPAGPAPPPDKSGGRVSSCKAVAFIAPLYNRLKRIT